MDQQRSIRRLHINIARGTVEAHRMDGRLDLVHRLLTGELLRRHLVVERLGHTDRDIHHRLELCHPVRDHALVHQ